MINLGKKSSMKSSGFTIIELLMVTIVIGILASIGAINYGNYKKSLTISQLKSDLNGVATAMEDARNFGTGYPANVNALSTFKPSQGVVLTGGSTDGGITYCVNATSSSDSSLYYYVRSSNNLNVQQGTC